MLMQDRSVDFYSENKIKNTMVTFLLYACDLGTILQVSIIGAKKTIAKVKGRHQDTDRVRPSDGNRVCD